MGNRGPAYAEATAWQAEDRRRRSEDGGRRSASAGNGVAGTRACPSATRHGGRALGTRSINPTTQGAEGGLKREVGSQMSATSRKQFGMPWRPIRTWYEQRAIF